MSAAIRYHMRYFSAERLSFVKRRSEAAAHPYLYMSIIIDFCEKVLLPHRVPAVKAWLRKSNRFSTTIVGLLDHGHKQYFYYYPTFAWPQNPNLVLSILWQHLEYRFSNFQGGRPPTLYLQADNKVAENKNSFTFCFAVLLVLKGIFSEIYLHYLLAGHSHEDVDQLFSVWKKLMKICSAALPEDFLNLVDRAYVTAETRPELVPVAAVWDWKTWFGQHMNRLHFHTEPRSFHIYRNPEGNVVMKAKKGATDGVWSEEMNVLPHSPQGFPQPIPRAPAPREVVTETRACVASGVLTAQQRMDWVDVLEMYEAPGPVHAYRADPFEPLVMPPPPVDLHAQAGAPVRITCTARTVPSRSDFTAYSGLFVAVCPDADQADGEDFWFACIVKVCPVLLKVRWWVEEEDGIWMEDPDNQTIDKIRPNAVILSFPNFAADGFQLTDEDKENIREKLVEMV